MKPEQALDLLEKVTATFQGSRQDHVNIQLSLNTIREALKPKSKLSGTATALDKQAKTS